MGNSICEIGKVLAEGKTKQIICHSADGRKVKILSKNDITAGDGAKHALMEGKEVFSTTTTCNTFGLLKASGLPVAFDERCALDAFVAPGCRMLPWEVILRRRAGGSVRDRNPHVPKGHLLPRLVLEFFLKTKGKEWKGVASGKSYLLPKDDPLAIVDEAKRQISLFYPGHTSEERQTAPVNMLVGQTAFLVLPFEEVFRDDSEYELLAKMEDLGRRAFLVLEKAWHLVGGELIDIKFEFGLDPDGRLLLADVVDSDSWRVTVDGIDISKQSFRDGESVERVAGKFEIAAILTGRFQIPKQSVIIWRGSPSDDVSAIESAIQTLSEGIIRTEVETLSLHKETVQGIIALDRHFFGTPNSVGIFWIGRSNGAGPTCSAHTTAPIFSGSPTVEDCPNDVWSSLRMPSKVPVATVLHPENIALAALNTLALFNPALYARLRLKVEERRINIMQIA